MTHPDQPEKKDEQGPFYGNCPHCGAPFNITHDCPPGTKDHIVDANKMDRLGDANKTMGEGPFKVRRDGSYGVIDLDGKLVHSMAFEAAQSDCQALNSVLLSWLSEKGWAAPEGFRKAVHEISELRGTLAEAADKALGMSIKYNNMADIYCAVTNERDALKKELSALKEIAGRAVQELRDLHHNVEWFQEDTYHRESPDRRQMSDVKAVLAEWDAYASPPKREGEK